MLDHAAVGGSFLLVATKRKKTIVKHDKEYNGQRELWYMFKAMIKFMHTFDISPVNGGLDEQPDIKGIVQAKLGDGTLSYVKVHQNTTPSQLTKARNRWRDWNRASLLEQDAYYITTMEHLNGELEAGRCSPQQYQRHAATLREQVTEQIQKRTKKYEKSIGIIDADFAEQRRAAKAVKAA